MLSSASRIVRKYDQLLLMKDLKASDEKATKEFMDLLEGAQNVNSNFREKLGEEIGQQVLMKGKSMLQTSRQYDSSNYFHVGPRYEMLDFINKITREVRKCREYESSLIGNVGQGNLFDRLNSSMDTQSSLGKKWFN